MHGLIGAALHEAERWDLVDRNVAIRATPPPVHAAQVKAPTPQQVQATARKAEEVEPGLASFILMAALTGARRGELRTLRWPDVDWQVATLAIARSVFEIHGGGWAEKATKTHAERRIGLEVPSGGFVFSRSPVGAEPYMPALVTKFTTRIARTAGVKTHLHEMRHFSTTEMIAAGIDVRTAAGRLGHADASVTLRVYSHALEQRVSRPQPTMFGDARHRGDPDEPACGRP